VQALRHELEHKAAMAAMERDWERELLERHRAGAGATARSDVEGVIARLRDLVPAPRGSLRRRV